MCYHISSAIRQFFFPFQNNSKNLDPSYKTDLDLWDYLRRLNGIIAQIYRTDIVTCSHSTGAKTPSYSQINMVIYFAEKMRSFCTAKAPQIFFNKLSGLLQTFENLMSH